MRERYGASEEHCKANIFCYTLGSPQTLQEPLNNIVRVAYQALAAVLGGVQTLATTAYDEAVELPSDEAVLISLRTQQILAYETGAARSTDPLAGSYLVEHLTNQLEAAILGKLAEIEAAGVALRALESGWIAAEIEEESYRQQRAIESGERVVVGVNKFRLTEKPQVRHRLAAEIGLEQEQIQRTEAVRAVRDQALFEAAMSALRSVAMSDRNTIPALIDAVRARATIGEIGAVLKSVWGVHVP